MGHDFHVEILSFSNLQEIDGAWTPVDFAALLDETEFGDRSEIAEADLREMCIMSLQDLDPEKAAYVVLKHVLGDALRDGQLHNMANEMLDEKLWEEYVDPACHERLFNVGSLLYAAMPRTFPKPDAVCLKLEATAGNPTAGALLTAAPKEAFLVRLLADGMDDHAVLHRLYGEQLAAKSFPSADQVVWIVRTDATNDDAMTIEVIGSGYWLDALERTQSYDSNAYADDAGAG